MIRIKDHKQQELFDPWGHLSPKRHRMLDEGWPGLFREHLLEELPVRQMRSYFTEGVGRPSKELNTMLGVLLLQQTMDLTDKAAIEQLAFNIQWHYAFNLPEESDDAKYISEKTLYTMRQIMIENHLDEVMFDAVTDKLAVVFGVDPKNQRIDSVHIKSNMRRLGRIGIFSQTIHKFLVNLKRHHQNLFDAIANEIIDRYLGQKAQAAFAMVKPSASEKTLVKLSADLFDLIEHFKVNLEVTSMHSYKLMQRVLNDQCHLILDTDGKKVTVKKPADIPSDSLQNPSDPDATYSGHKGQGYQVQVMETFCTSEDGEKKEQTLNLITHVSVQTACESDAQALVPAIADVQVRQLSPGNVLADTLYSSDANHQAAALAGINLVAPTYKGKTSKLSLSEFTFDKNGCVTGCPAGIKPENCKQNTSGKFVAEFNKSQCKSCGQCSICPSKLGINNAYVRYNPKQQRLAIRRAQEQTDEFIETYRWRAGVEATMSEFDKLTGVKKLRVRGRKAVRYVATMKAAGLNLLRAARVKNARAKVVGTNASASGHIFSIFGAIKERISRFFKNPAETYRNLSAVLCRGTSDLKLAA